MSGLFDSIERALNDPVTVENIDLPEVVIDLYLQHSAYDSALATDGEVITRSLMDFLR